MTATEPRKTEPPVVIGALALRTLSGDIRNRMEKLARSWTKPFDDLSQVDQQDVIDTLTAVGEDTARESIMTVAGRALPTLGMKVVSAQRKGKTMRVTLEAPYTKQGWAGFGDCEEVIAVQAAPDTYYGERAPLRARPDQPDLDLDDEGAEGEETGVADEGDAQVAENTERLEAGIKPLDAEGVPAQPGETADALAAGQQAQALADAAGDGGTAGAQQAGAEPGADLLPGVEPLDASKSEPLTPDPAAAPKKRGRRTVEQRQGDNARAADSGYRVHT